MNIKAVTGEDNIYTFPVFIVCTGCLKKNGAMFLGSFWGGKQPQIKFSLVYSLYTILMIIWLWLLLIKENLQFFSSFNYLLNERRTKRVEKIRTLMLQDFLQTTVGLNISALYIDVNKCRSISEEIISWSLLFKHGGSKILLLLLMNNISNEKMCNIFRKYASYIINFYWQVRYKSCLGGFKIKGLLS